MTPNTKFNIKSILEHLGIARCIITVKNLNRQSLRSRTPYYYCLKIGELTEMGDIERLARKIVDRDPVYKHLYGERKERAVQYEYRRLWRVIFAIYPCLRKDKEQVRLFPPKRD